MKKIALIIGLITFSLAVFAQNERKFVRNGNKLFMEAVRDTTKLDTTKFSNAETEYRKALNKKPANLKWNYNLADALYKQRKFDEAAGKFDELGDKLSEPAEKARAYHNLGNSELMQQKLDESIESYKKALKNNPSDLETKYNLAYAQMLKKKKQQQQKQQNKNKNKNKDKNKDQKNKDKQNKDQQNKDQQKKDQQKKQDQQKQEQQKQNQQKQPQNKISKQDAQQLLQALQNDERKIQAKVKKAKVAKAKKVKVEKEW